MNTAMYKTLDPDELYYNFPEGSITFFYVPDTENLYVEPYPTSHQDMLIDNDDLFDDVYGNLEWGPKERKSWASRGKALQLTNVLAGRIAAVGDNIAVSFWSNPPKDQLNVFFEKLFQQYSALKKRKNSIIVIIPKAEPYSLGGNAVKDTVMPKETPNEKKFNINGKSYSLQDLQRLRSAVHTKDMSLGDPNSVLCHPDLSKYPELVGYKPSNCGEVGQVRSTHASKWRDAARSQNLPYTYSYGETFKDFVKNNEK